MEELIDNIYFRYRKKKRDGNTKKKCGQRSRRFNNDAFTNDYADTGKIIYDKTLIVGKVVSFCHVV
jgi:hypothetical protein